MNRGSHATYRPTYRVLMFCLLFISAGLATCALPTNRAVVAPVKAAATSDTLLGQGVAGPTQPLSALRSR